MQKVIAIDGPSGSGKSTLAKKLAEALDILYIDTGAMYRGLALDAFNKSVPYEESEELNQYLQSIDLNYAQSSEQLIVIDGVDLTKEIREHRVSGFASQFSQIKSVRSYLLKFQRRLGVEKICVMEGRDITTVVFPEAFCKIFVTASPEVRAQRRWDQLKRSNPSAESEGLSYDQVLEDVLERDRLDTQREVSPLKIAEDAEVVDTSTMSEKEVLDRLVEIAKGKAQEASLPL